MLSKALDIQAFRFIKEATDEFPKSHEVLEVWTRLSATLIRFYKTNISLSSGVTIKACAYFLINLVPRELLHSDSYNTGFSSYCLSPDFGQEESC